VAVVAGRTEHGDRVEPIEQFARNLRRQRAQAGLTQDALAAACHLHRTEISLLERAGREPRLSTIVKLARALRVEPAELLDGVS
jgi:transcriptional regulator with XRE-family HTH domain